jgi:hypothetical protein
MPSEFGCEIKMELSVPDFMDASVPLSQIADKVATDSRRNIRSQTSLDGSAYRRLSKKTIQDKIREGSANPRMALYRKGIMYRAIHVYRQGKNNFEIGIIPVGKPRRDLVGLIHQEIGPVIRSFLGFTRQTYNWANNRIERWLSEKTQKAAKKFINLKY